MRDETKVSLDDVPHPRDETASGPLSNHAGDGEEPASEAAPVRLESVLVEPQHTTVYLSGNSPGLDAVVNAVRSNFSNVKVSEARRGDAMRLPRPLPM